MSLSLKASRACAEMAKVLYGFLPGSGHASWRGHVSFQTVAKKVGIGDFWTLGSKEPAIARLLEETLNRRRDHFEPLILEIVKEGLKYREKNGNPVQESEIQTLNGLVLDVGFKFPALWEPAFLSSLRIGGTRRAADLVDRELKRESIRTSEASLAANKLSELRAEFYTLAQMGDRQAAGKALERVLNSLFRLFNLAPREAFRVIGEEIDGSFELDNEVYLIEAKWESRQLSEAPLLVFREKIAGKSAFTRGLYLAINGCTSEAITSILRGKQPNFFLMDGYDLSLVLEGQIALDILLRAKARRLAERGDMVCSARELI